MSTGNPSSYVPFTMHDNYTYRASFTRRNRHETPPPDTPMTTAAGHHIVPQGTHSPPRPAGADQGVADALESVLAGNTRRVYGTQWRLFTGWCDEVGLTSLPAEPLTVARYLAAGAKSGARIATLRLTTSAISMAHE